MAGNNANNVLEWAFKYQTIGWSIIPIKSGTKKPAISWKQYQNIRADKAQLYKWFVEDKYTSLAVVCGKVSGGLTILDLDSEEACQWWKNTHPKLAETLPTAQTNKGLHVYFRSELFPKRNGENVDLLCDGAYAILPPSPDKSWIIPLKNNLSLLDPFEWGLDKFNIKRPGTCRNFTEETNDTEDIEETDDIDEIESHKVKKKLSDYEDDVIVQVNQAIEKTVPKKIHTRNSGIFMFCRILKGIEQFKDNKASDLEPIVKLWWEKAYDEIYTKSFPVTYADFVHAWKRVKYPYGDTIVQQAVKNALATDVTPVELQKYAEEQEIVFLGTILKELQKLMGDESIYLASRKAAGIVGVSHTEICKYYELFEEEGILVKVEDHTNKTAKRYKFIITDENISFVQKDKN